MSSIWVRPGPLSGRVRASPSKSQTHRALATAASLGIPLSLRDPLEAEDTWATAGALRALGVPVRPVRGRWDVGSAVSEPPRGGRPRISCRSSGTTLRFATVLAARGWRWTRLDGTPRLRKRPIAELLDPLRRLGAEVEVSSVETPLPLGIRGPLRPGFATVDVSRSSQPLSGLLIGLAGLPEASRIRPTGTPVSAPYAALTIRTLRQLGARVRFARGIYTVGGPPERSPPRSYWVPADASSAAYLWAAAAVTGGSVKVDGDFSDGHPDLVLLDCLSESGASVARFRSGIRVSGPLHRPFDVDLSDAPDLAPLVCVLAATLIGRSYVRGAPHLALKESDRRQGSVRLVRAMGASVRSSRADLEIDGTPHARRLRLRDLNDHRILLSAVVGALAADGPSELGPVAAARKSYPRVWGDLASLGAQLSEIGR